jgi:hypothetical protein
VWSTCQFPYLEAGGGFVFEVGRHGGTIYFEPLLSLWMEERFLAGNRLMALRPKISPTPHRSVPTYLPW